MKIYYLFIFFVVGSSFSPAHAGIFEALFGSSDKTERTYESLGYVEIQKDGQVFVYERGLDEPIILTEGSGISFQTSNGYTYTLKDFKSVNEVRIWKNQNGVFRINPIGLPSIQLNGNKEGTETNVSFYNRGYREGFLAGYGKGTSGESEPNHGEKINKKRLYPMGYKQGYYDGIGAFTNMRLLLNVNQTNPYIDGYKQGFNHGIVYNERPKALPHRDQGTIYDLGFEHGLDDSIDPEREMKEEPKGSGAAPRPSGFTDPGETVARPEDSTTKQPDGETVPRPEGAATTQPEGERVPRPEGGTVVPKPKSSTQGRGDVIPNNGYGTVINRDDIDKLPSVDIFTDGDIDDLISDDPSDNSERLDVSNINYDIDSSELEEESLEILDKIIEYLNKYSFQHLQIHGHADNQGSEDYNLELSERRAQAVFQYLSENGIAREQMTYTAWGESQPKVPNTSPENMSINRRVEFVIIRESKEQ